MDKKNESLKLVVLVEEDGVEQGRASALLNEVMDGNSREVMYDMFCRLMKAFLESE